MKLRYDPQVDALYIRFREAPIEHSEEATEGVIVDYDTKERVVGLEILDASEVLGGEIKAELEILTPGSKKAER